MNRLFFYEVHLNLPQEVIEAKTIDTFVSRACSNPKHFVVVVVALLTLRKVTKTR